SVIAGADMQVKFSNAADAKYALDPLSDAYTSSMFFSSSEKYEYLPINGNAGKKYKVPWKFMASNETDKVKVDIPANIVRDSLHFITSTKLEVELDANNLTLSGGDEGSFYEVYALYNDTDGQQKLCGKLKVFTKTEKPMTVHLVPFYADSGLESKKSKIKQGLDSIYSRYGINWEVDIIEGLAGENTWDLDENEQMTLGDDFLSNYSGEQKMVNGLIMGLEGRYNQTDCYVALFDTTATSENGIDDEYKQGEMPIGKQFAYLYGVNGDIDARLLAHELGHGKFKLRHTFGSELSLSITQGTTTNLMDYPSADSGTTGNDSLVYAQWEAIHNPAIIGKKFQSDEDGAYQYYISDNFIQNKKVEIAYWEWQKDGAPELTWEEIEEEYFTLTMNNYQKSLFHGIATDIANLKSRDAESAEMFQVLVEEGNIDEEILTTLIKERHELAEYYRVVVPLLQTADILTKYCVVLSIVTGPSNLPAMGAVGGHIAKLTGAKALSLGRMAYVTFAKLQPGKWLALSGKLFLQGAAIDAAAQLTIVTVLEGDFRVAVEELDIADIAVTGAINVVTGGSVSIRKFFRMGTKIAVVKGTTVITLELASATTDWQPFNGSDQFLTLFDGSKELQNVFCDFVLGLSNNVLPDEMLDILKKWAKADFDVRWYSTLTNNEKVLVRKIYDIVNSNSFKTALETNSLFVKTFLQNIVPSEFSIKTISVEEYDVLPDDYVMPKDNTKVIIPGFYEFN
nr:hypothetical protein [Bacteroidales bacterium]